MIFRQLVLAAAVVLCAATASKAGMILDAGARVTYDDNLAASSSVAGAKGDLFTTVFVTAGRYTELSEAEKYLIIKGGLESFAYDTYDELNGVGAFVSAGVYRRYGEVLSSLMTVTARLKDFSENARDSSSIGAGFELSQQSGRSFRLREWYAYELLGARDESFSYTGHAAGVWATLKIARSWFFHAGYSLLFREYEEPAGATSRSQTTSLLLEHTLARKLYVFTAWDRQRYDDGGGVAPVSDALYTIGIAYSL